METLGAFLDHQVRRFGPLPAVLSKPRYRTEVWSYGRLWDETNRIACWLRERGVEKGDRVVLWAPNSPWWVAAFFGTLRLGGIAVPLDVRSDHEFVRRVVAQTEPKLALLGRAASAGWDCPVPVASIEEFSSLPQPPDLSEPSVTPDDVAEIMFTSGTTGDPKGVILTHRNILANVAAVDRVVPHRRAFRLLSLLPLSHMFEQTVGLLLPLRRGASVYYPASRQSTTLFHDLKEQDITTLLVVPQVLRLLLAAIEREVINRGKEQAWRRLQELAAYLPLPARRLLFRALHQRLGGKLAFFVSGGAPLEPELIRTWELFGIPVLQGYGATEAAPVITATSLHDRDARTVGRAIPGVQLRLAADGEVLVKGPNITPGYWRNAQATQEAFTDGWYSTGDLGYLDDKGCLYLRGRKKDCIVLASGQNVYAEDVERILKQVLGVAEAVVLGLPTPRGPQVHAVLVCDRSAPHPTALLHQANARLAAHQQIQGFTLWPEGDFPRTHTLKVKKQEVLTSVLRQQQERKTPATPQLPGPPDEPPLPRLIAAMAGVPAARLGPGATLGDDAGLDSLGRVELLAAIEGEFGVYLDESHVGPHTTVAELAALVSAQESSARPDFPRWPLSPFASVVRAGLHVPTLALLGAVAPASVSGREVLADLSPPVLFVANHTSHLDSPVILQALPGNWRRRVAVAAAADYFFAGTLLGAAAALLLSAFPFSRTTAIRPTLEHCAWLLDRGWSILLFPEGTRSTTGKLGPFKAGVGLLAVELDAPVIPVRIEGLFAILPKGRSVPRPGRVALRFGRPLRFGSGTSYDVATAAVGEAVRSL